MLVISIIRSRQHYSSAAAKASPPRHSTLCACTRVGAWLLWVVPKGFEGHPSATVSGVDEVVVAPLDDVDSTQKYGLQLVEPIMLMQEVLPSKTSGTQRPMVESVMLQPLAEAHAEALLCALQLFHAARSAARIV